MHLMISALPIKERRGPDASARGLATAQHKHAEPRRLARLVVMCSTKVAIFWHHAFRKIRSVIMTELQRHAIPFLAHMKKNKSLIIICVALIGASQIATGQVSTNFLFRNRTPIINDTIRCDLSPLFEWWTMEMKAPKKHQSTNMVTRPMPAWVHINGLIEKDASTGWIVSAIVENGPGKGKPMKLIIAHPPRKELGRYIQKMALMKTPLPAPDTSAQEDRIDTLHARAFVANTVGDQSAENAYMTAEGREYNDMAVRTKTYWRAVEERDQILQTLGTFPPDWKSYHADVFALSTSRQLGGLPIFDAGLSFEK